MARSGFLRKGFSRPPDKLATYTFFRLWRKRNVKTCSLIVMALTGCLFHSPQAVSQSGGSPARTAHHFAGLDVSFDYSYPLVLCKGGPQTCEECNRPSLTDDKSTMIACVGDDKKIYAGYNLSQGPALSIAVLSDVRDAAKCLSFPEDELAAKPKDEHFNGVTFKAAVHDDAAMSHAYRTYWYPAVHGGPLYDLELLIVTVNVGVFDPGEQPKKFTAADERKVVHNFTRMLNTLRLGGS